jgi:hypothetical protein
MLPSRRRTTPVVLLLVGTLLSLGLVVDGSAVASTASRSGAYAGGPSYVTSFATWRSRPAGIAHAFVADTDWSEIEIKDSWAQNWAKTPYASSMLITMPMLPKDTTTTLQVGATGSYDAHFKAAANRLVAQGMGNAIIRLGWEFNQKWPRWSARTDPTAYVAYWRHIVTAMRSVTGAGFTFTWCPGYGYAGWDATTAWPGDTYVDIVSLDMYDAWYNHPDATPEQRWANIVTGTKQGGLTFWAAFATAHAKPIALSEWGLVDKYASMAGTGGGGGDDPYYIQQVHDWLNTHQVAYESYFNKDAANGKHKLDNGQYPLAAARYRTEWAL